jgi:hypothetical protein
VIDVSSTLRLQASMNVELRDARDACNGKKAAARPLKKPVASVPSLAAPQQSTAAARRLLAP